MKEGLERLILKFKDMNLLKKVTLLFLLIIFIYYVSAYRIWHFVLLFYFQIISFPKSIKGFKKGILTYTYFIFSVFILKHASFKVLGIYLEQNVFGESIIANIALGIFFAMIASYWMYLLVAVLLIIWFRIANLSIKNRDGMAYIISFLINLLVLFIANPFA